MECVKVCVHLKTFTSHDFETLAHICRTQLNLPVLSRDNVEPWRDGGFEPCLLRGREFGFEPVREPLGVMPVLVLVYVTLRGV